MLKEQSNVNLIIQLLEQKNDLLRLFLEISECERKSFKARNFDNLEELYESREDLLANINSIDKRIDLYSAGENTATVAGEDKSRVSTLLAQ
ncbi:MAG: flagellar export chaperone FlgN, partial [Bdellovibrionaceae bacterium]|nr:flagellar export chaperone FlgN [Pseudobdellovibrionaceae bacterium]